MSIILIVGLYTNRAMEEKDVLENSTSLSPPKPDYDIEEELKSQQEPDAVAEKPRSGAGAMLGKEASTLIKTYGEPIRKDPSAYGYEWWIYHKDQQYVQFGVEGNQVITAFATGQTDVSPFKVGQKSDSIFRSNLLNTEIVINKEEGTYRFELSEEDFNVRPLIPLGDIYAQLYIDKFTGTLSSVRFLTKDCLLRQRPYEMVYRGDLPEVPEPTSSAWTKIQTGSEQQILDLTNMIRARFELNELIGDPSVAEVARLHSKEMFEKKYFAHESPSAGDLGDRLTKAKIPFRIAGENIAANYIDGPAAVEGWLNSEDHREALLEEEFVSLGVGVYHKYYTQNFVTKR
ncbi:CAP domain-containing protein [Bacillus sp. REN10]|uniref:CAP domain-containing protein n=1 Tax=Bacillus sp. REN10 TaxID=2782541 RepID=UPI001EEEB5C1|nr:CAP domain-containing protein [Bacillus sp. REN10]